MTQQTFRRWNFYNIGNSSKYPNEVLGPLRYVWSQRNKFIALGLQEQQNSGLGIKGRAYVMQRNSIIRFLEQAKNGDYCYLNGSANQKTPLVTHRGKYQGKFFTTSKKWAADFAHLGMMLRTDLNPFEGYDHPHITGTIDQVKFFVEVDGWEVIPNPGKGPGRPGQILYEVTDTTKNSEKFPVGSLRHLVPIASLQLGPFGDGAPAIPATRDLDGADDDEVPGEIIRWKP